MMIKLKLFAAYLLLVISASPALADIQFAIGEPSEGSINTGIGQISGWAVSDEVIVSVEALVDGASLGLVPYGGSRQDVANVFPDLPNSEFSGWAMKWNWSLHEEGEHLLTIIVTEEDGDTSIKEVNFSVTGFRSAFISNPDAVQIADATIELTDDGTIFIRDALIEDELVDVELCWVKSSQQFLIKQIIYADDPPQNQAPIADAGSDRNVERGDNVSITGQGSDPDGSIDSWSWAHISGPSVSLSNADSLQVSFTAPDTAGDIRLRLTVTDDEGATDSDDVVITVAAAPVNQAPVADAGSDLSVAQGDYVSITGEGSDPEGPIDSWSWAHISGPSVSLSNANSQQVSFTAPDTAGDIRLRLTVTDMDGADDSDDVIVTVEALPVNQDPTADAGSDLIVDQGDNVSITGQGSDPDGSIESWSWAHISGPSVSLSNANSQQVSFTAPNTAGDIRLRLTVTDNEGADDSDDVIVTVSAPPGNQDPSADAGPDRTVDQGDNVSITGQGSDPDGSIDSWSWTHISGPSVSLSNADSQQVSFTAPDTAGDIRLRLTVTDNEGADDSDDVYITVREDTGPDNTTGSTLQSMLSHVNEARRQTRMCGNTEYPGISQANDLQWDGSLAEIAKLHSMEMARHGFFTHESLDGTSMGTRVFPYWSGYRVGENIAASSANRSDSYVVDLWLNSPGHCALIMDPDFTHAGIGVGHNEDNGYTYHHFWTLDFGG